MFEPTSVTFLGRLDSEHRALGFLTLWFCSENEQTIQKAWSRISSVATFTDYLPLLLSFVMTGGLCLVSAAGSKSSFASYHASIVLSSLLATAPQTKTKPNLSYNQWLPRWYQLRRILLHTCLNFLLLICSADNIAIQRDRRDKSPCLNLLLSLLVLDRKETNAKVVQVNETGFS